MGEAYQIKDKEIEPPYRTVRHEEIVPQMDDYHGDLPAAGMPQPATINRGDLWKKSTQT